MIVRWGLSALPAILGEIGSSAPLVVTTRRWRDLELPASQRFLGVRPHAGRAGAEGAIEAAGAADALVPVGGGSAIDTAKAVSAATGLPVISIPTTYSGAEWTAFYGVRDEEARRKGGGAGARLAGIVYEPELTISLPRAESGGTALNALAHCAEALYVAGRTDEGDREALAGARLIAGWLPRVLADGDDPEARRNLLEGAMHAGAALGAAGLGLGHAMAQALGGRYGLPHGALNALCLPPALRFNEPAAPGALAALGDAIGAADPAERMRALARLAGFERLRELGVPEDELDLVAEQTSVRAGARANPRQASPAEIAVLLRSIW